MPPRRGWAADGRAGCKDATHGGALVLQQQMKRAKPKTPQKKVRNRPAMYSLARKKEGTAVFHRADGDHTDGGNGVLHEDATGYHTQLTTVLDVAPAGFAIEPPDVVEAQSPETAAALDNIEKLNLEAETRWANKLCVDNTVTRALVSFQANKGRAVYRWFKYKEAFSAGLIEHLLNKYRISKGILLDPFAGSGTALFAMGCKETMKKDAEVYANI